MKTSDLHDVAATLARIATPAMAPKELVKAVKAVHPKASRKDITRAAFYSIIANSEDAAKAKHLQAFAIAERIESET
ncbi:hypothetical protein [Mesorhizobium sp. 128a]